jgi:dTDP-4-dehydrorhamnose reductase
LGEVLALDRHSTTYCGDLSKPEELAQTVLAYKPDFIVNAAAHTAVDKAESEPELAKVLNTDAPAALAKAAAQVGAWLVHYSTDYVFDGSGTHARQEGEGTGPLSVYGQTKLDGEKTIVASGCKYLIFRTSWVYGARGGNFAKTMLRLAQERDKLTVINDQHGAPTGADLIADVTAHAMRRVLNTQNISFSGVYHIVAAGEITWHGYASHVIEKAKAIKPELGWKVDDIAPVPTSVFPTPAARPLNSRLCTEKLQQAFGLVLPPWQQGVDRMLAEIL